MRRGNEDNLYADANEYRGLFIVADGMGGHAAGEVASQMAVDLISSELADLNDLGDSRIYLVRDGEMKQLTRDHSLVQEQVDAGLITPEQARHHPQSNVITCCIGMSSEIEPEIISGETKVGDVFLLASDGLTGMVEDKRLQQLLQSRANPERIVNAMIADANNNGGIDNITAIVVKVITADTRFATREVTPVPQGRSHG